MRPLMLSELETPLCGHLIGPDCEVSSIVTDSRGSNTRAMFVALRGENFDGHDFLAQAEKSGAVAALVSVDTESGLPQLRVDDTQRALGKLGAYNRQSFTGPLVAITGSSGKTTAKNMIHAVLSQRGETLATRGNLNNEIGVPLTLLGLGDEHEFAVVEMGAARKGDIAWLCELGTPTIALLLNALPAHLEGFGDIEDVALAKGEIFDNLAADTVAVINADSPWADQWRRRAAPAVIVDYAVTGKAAITAETIISRGIDGISFTAITPEGDIAICLKLPGLHNVSNALAAVTVGLSCDLSLEEIRLGLESLSPVEGRTYVLQAKCGARLIDDCYNANPGSVRASIDLLADCVGRRTLILGAMKELGATSESLHREMGSYAKAAGIEEFWGIGEELKSAVEAFGKTGRYFSNRERAIKALPNAFSQGDVVLMKGSRSVGMEVLLNALRDNDFGGEG